MQKSVSKENPFPTPRIISVFMDIFLLMLHSHFYVESDSFLHDLNHFCTVMSHLEAGYELILINTFFTSYL